jgi:hypothetical protein
VIRNSRDDLSGDDKPIGYDALREAMAAIAEHEAARV